MDEESVQRGRSFTQGHTVNYELVMESGLSTLSLVLFPLCDAICVIVACWPYILFIRGPREADTKTHLGAMSIKERMN